MRLTQLLTGITFSSTRVGENPDPIILDITQDSRQVTPGCLFLAYPGGRVDGCAFIAEAIAKGAVAILHEVDGITRSPVLNLPTSCAIPVIAVPQLIEKQGLLAARFYGDASANMTLIGITGTNGKTSCSQFIAQGLALQQHRCGVIGTLGSGVWPDLAAGSLTTPDPIFLQKKMADLKREGAQSVAMEVSSHSLSQHRVAGLHFDIAVFTQISRDHLDYHGDMASYRAAKSLLFLQPGLQHAVLNADDELGRELITQHNDRLHVVSYSLDPASRFVNDNAVIAREIKMIQRGYTVAVSTPWGDGEFSTQLMGRFNISNLLAVLAVLGIMQLPLSTILNIIPELHAVAGRMQILGGGVQPTVVVDYAHTPDALQKVLLALRDHRPQQLWCVFGCGGDRDRGKRPQMAAIAEQYSNKVIVTNDNPRSEPPMQIVAEIMAGFQHPQQAQVELDRAAAIAAAITQAHPQDIILVAGKGHEAMQIIGDQVLPFSDVEVVRQCLSGVTSD